MDRATYRSLLQQLPIKNPTPDDMARLCPHLTPDQAVAAFTTNNGYVACPPLRIRNAFQILSLSKGWTEEIKTRKGGSQVVTGTKQHPPMINWSYTGRTPASYADGRANGDMFLEYTHMREAMRFAEDNWGTDLILDDWVSVVNFYIEDPTDLLNGRPRWKATLHVTLNRDLNELINDHSKPESDLFDDAISQMTLDRFVGQEQKGGRGEFTERNCGHCGAGLSLSSCTGCHHPFSDDGWRSGWSTPLSRKMVAFLRENGHTFAIDPEIAWAQERERYSLNTTP